MDNRSQRTVEIKIDRKEFMITSNNQKLQEQVALAAGTSGDAINVERMIPQATFSQAGTEEVSVQDLSKNRKHTSLVT